jgi:hypothetical protein
MLHDNVFSAIKQVSDIPIHLDKLKTRYGSEFYWLEFQEQKLEHNSCWDVYGDRVPSYDELTTSASLVDPIWSEGAGLPFRDKILRKGAWSNRPQPTRDIVKLFTQRTAHDWPEML